MNYFEDLNPYLMRDDEIQKQVDPLLSKQTIPQTMNQSEMYTQNILFNNIGKSGSFYFTYTGSTEWRDRVYTGIIEQAGLDHFVIFNPQQNKRYLLASIYYCWAEFDEELDYG